jgi:hypothetical protein
MPRDLKWAFAAFGAMPAIERISCQTGVRRLNGSSTPECFAKAWRMNSRSSMANPKDSCTGKI